MPKTPSTPIRKTCIPEYQFTLFCGEANFCRKFMHFFCKLSNGLKDEVAYQKWQIWGMLTPLCIYGAKSSISKEMNFQMHEYASWLLKDWFFGLEWSDGSAVWGPCRRDCGRTARRFHLTFYWSIYSSTHIGKNVVFGRLHWCWKM